MKITRFLSIIALGVLTLSTVGCNKEPEPIVLTGTWNVDTVQTKVYIKYDEFKAQENPIAFNYLKDNIQKIRKNLIQPDKIIFSGTNYVSFKFPNGMSIDGTYSQIDEVFFKLTIMEFPDGFQFPDGLVCASDNKVLEIYYPRGYVMSVLRNMLRPSDPPYSIFEELITAESSGLALFRR